MRTAAIISFLFLAGCGEQADPKTLVRGEKVYMTHCAACHGAKLEGQPNWKEKLPDGRLPAPPHNDTGHTWQHSDRWLFHVVERGFVPPMTKRGYKSDMPAFGDKLSDGEIRAVVAYIKAHWSEETNRKRERELRRRSTAETLVEHFGK